MTPAPGGDDAEPEGFLARWSQRKRAMRVAAQEPPPAASSAAPREPTTAASLADPAAQPDAIAKREASVEGAAVDPASLPDPETLGAGDDFSPFLRKGVPEALKSAALRRMWRTDPFISSFREMADYDWDFNAPGYQVPLSEQEVAELLDKVLPRAAPAGTPDSAQPGVAQPGAAQAGAAQLETPSLAQVGRGTDLACPADVTIQPEAAALPAGAGRDERVRLSAPTPVAPLPPQGRCDQPAQRDTAASGKNLSSTQPALAVPERGPVPPTPRPRRHGGAIPA